MAPNIPQKENIGSHLLQGTLAAIQVGRLKDSGKETPEMISMIKRQNCDRALYGARTLQEIFGGNAVSDEYGIGRHVANLFVTQTYEGQSDIHSKLQRFFLYPAQAMLITEQV